VRASAPGSTGRLVGGEPPVAVSFEMDGRTDGLDANKSGSSAGRRSGNGTSPVF
jgi:hypothetical protein